RDFHVTGVQTCALPIWSSGAPGPVLARHESRRRIPLRQPDASRRRPSVERDAPTLRPRGRAGKKKNFSAVLVESRTACARKQKRSEERRGGKDGDNR